MQLLQKAAAKGVQLLLPEDFIIADAFSNDAKTQTTSSMQIPDEWMGLDIGVKAQEQFAEVIRNSKTIFWNGTISGFLKWKPLAKEPEALPKQWLMPHKIMVLFH